MVMIEVMMVGKVDQKTESMVRKTAFAQQSSRAVNRLDAHAMSTILTFLMDPDDIRGNFRVMGSVSLTSKWWTWATRSSRLWDPVIDKLFPIPPINQVQRQGGGKLGWEAVRYGRTAFFRSEENDGLCLCR